MNVRSSILGSNGRAKEAQSEFLVLVEDAIRQPDLAASVQRYQLAIDEAKVRLNLAVCPGSNGRAKEAQSEFLVLVEDAIRQPDLAASVQRYQLAIDEVKVKLNLAVCPGAWLMPGWMVINTESVVGYNNQLKQAGAGMKLGIK